MKQTFRWRRRSFAVMGRERINGRPYLLLDRLTGGARRKYLAFCPIAGPTGNLRLVHYVTRSPQAVQFLKVLGRVDIGHFNFPGILEIEKRQNEIVIVSEWIDGEPLEDRLWRSRRRLISPIIAFRLFRGLAHTLHQLNNRLNVVHGDIKPGNLIVARDALRLVVIDFGSAWTVEKSAVRLGGDGRTDGYASPEQHCEARLIDFRSDMFSASAVAYSMFTGKLPYSDIGGKAGVPRLRATCGLPLEPPSGQCKRKMPHDVWGLIDPIVMRGLDLDPDRRYPNTNSWVQEINEADARMKLPAPVGLPARIVFGLLDWFARPPQRPQ